MRQKVVKSLLLEEARNPRPIAEAPFTLRSLQNEDYILRSYLSTDGDNSKLEQAIKSEKNWDWFSTRSPIKSSVILNGEAIEVGNGAKNILYSSPKNVEPSDGKFANSRISLHLAVGNETYLAGWDRAATGDWHSILRLTAEQAKAAQSLLSKFSKSPEWIGHSKIKLGEAGNRIIRNGIEMEISNSQTQDLGVIHLDKMRDSFEALQSHKPELIPPSDSLARQCEFKWVSAPPVPSKSAAEDQLHDDWDNARDEISARLNSLDKLNVVSKIPGFGRKAKELQKSINAAIEKLETINDPKSLTELIDKVEDLTKSVSNNISDIKKAEEEEERKIEYNKQLEEHNSNVSKAKEVIERLNPKLLKSLDEREVLKQQLSKAKKVESSKIEGDIQNKLAEFQQYQAKIKSAKEMIESNFEFTPKSKSINPKKTDKTIHKFLGDISNYKIEIKVPKEGLPMVGTLFKDGDIRYLAVFDWEHVEQGRKDAKRLNANLCASREVLK